ncbi:NADH-quinone oxidoreductase subunit NuoN [Caulobacter sp. 17J65-9]|uniref:NADH-quinone oxidoreductase subunit NuoN n=1 Tax=Caulobacter sp. 17J65-9 TaxID=2709382 RepID=UPI0013C6F1CC|nr:NADH-quinone oxidoreductase subunit NuoN [Caulobacter sp. 17J65-9]NEX94463.1 NADH-quinone oxidoreductase subunit NuoN [Caulobacter sp. 17J65-9]
MDLPSALSLALPELILAIGAMAVLVFGAFRGERASGAVAVLAGAALVAAAFAAALGPLGVAFNGAFVMDRMAAYSKVAIYVASAFGIVLGHGWLGRVSNQKFEYSVLILLATIGMSMMVSSGDMISLYVGVELQSLALYVMAAFQRDDAKASEAGLKYFVLGALSSGLMLYGISLIYGFTGAMRFDAVAAAVSGEAGTGVIFGLVFLICGLAFKVSAAPFHMWTPDVYEGGPTPAVAFIAAGPKLAAMVLFARTLSQGFFGVHDQWAQVVMIIAAISFVVGAFGGLMQRDIKRLLAYSSIANMGYALLAVAAGTQAGIQALLVFLVLYMIDITGFFACLMALSRDGRPVTTIAELSGLRRVNPGVALALTVLSLSVLGMPPFSGFWGKYYVFKAAIGAGLWPIAVAGLVASVVAAFYYLRIIKVMWFDAAPAPTDGAPAETRLVAFASAAFCFPLVLVALALLDPAARNAASALGLG